MEILPNNEKRFDIIKIIIAIVLGIIIALLCFWLVPKTCKSLICYTCNSTGSAGANPLTGLRANIIPTNISDCYESKVLPLDLIASPPSTLFSILCRNKASHLRFSTIEIRDSIDNNYTVKWNEADYKGLKRFGFWCTKTGILYCANKENGVKLIRDDAKPDCFYRYSFKNITICRNKYLKLMSSKIGNKGVSDFGLETLFRIIDFWL